MNRSVYKLNKNIPEGTRDLIFDEADLYSDIIDKFKKIFVRSGFKQIITPSIEYYDVFDYHGQSISQEEMYKLTDNNGRLIVLRADNTTPAARVFAAKLKNTKYPQKLYYNQNVYRINNGYSGKRNEIMQSGVEIIGEGGLKNDLISITTAIDVFRSLGIKYKIEIGHVGYFNALIKEYDFDEEDIKLIRSYVNAKNAVSLDVMNKLESCERIRRIPLLFGGAEIFDEVENLAGDNKAALRALEYVKKIFFLLTDAGYGENIMVDMGIVHQIDYYTGVVFGGYLEGIGEPVLKGGRYDNLIRNFDCCIPATGFAVNVCSVADVLKKHKSRLIGTDKYIIHYDVENLAAAEKFKNSHENCEYSCFDDYETTVKYAEDNNIKFVVLITENGAEVKEI